MADSVDMLGDALVYALSLYVLNRGLRWRAGAAVVKGITIAAFGVGVAVGHIQAALRCNAIAKHDALVRLARGWS